MLCIFFLEILLISHSSAIFQLNGEPAGVVLGDDIDVTLNCIVDNAINGTTLQWLREDEKEALLKPMAFIFGIYEDKSCILLNQNPNYTFLCYPSVKQYKLVIPSAYIINGIQNYKWQCSPLSGTGSSNTIKIGLVVPVTMVAITPSNDNNIINAVNGKATTFICTTNHGRPAAWIQWYIGENNFTSKAQTQPPQKEGDTFISSSKLVYTGEEGDHNKTLYCEALNIEGRIKVKSPVKYIYIQLPVTNVTIQPTTDNNTINVVEGQNRTFTCTTDFCRPAAWIQWYVDGQNKTDMAQPQPAEYNGDLVKSSSKFVYNGNDDDHNKTIICEALNIEEGKTVQSKKQSIHIQVPVITVTITQMGINNVANVAVGATRTFSCTTGSSRPAASIQWYIGGDKVTNQAQPQTPQPDGDKFISSSRLVYTGKDEDHNKNIYCEAINIEGQDQVKSTEISVYIQKPVTTVTITPMRDSNMIDVIDGDSQSFNCTTGLSRPVAWIQWYIGSQNVTNQAHPQTPQQDGDKFISSSILVYTGKVADHKKSIYCEAVNMEGRDKVKSKETSIYIQIPLTSVTITPAGINNSADVVVGYTRTFSCSTGLSRPAARIQWYIGGDNVTNQAQPQTPHPDGDNFISSSTMMYTGKDEDHNNNIYCEAVNIEKRNKVKSIEITLYLELPPTDLTITPLADNNVISIMKGDKETLNCTTNSCRPAARIHWYIGTLNVTNHAQQQTQQLDGDRFVSSSRLVYQGKDADHNKTIYCEAVTVEGKYKVKSRKQFIYIFREPIPPSYIYVVCKSTTAIVILKLIENGMVTDDLYIQYTAGGQNMTSIKLHIIDIMHHIEYTVTGLYPGKHYNFSVLASNPFGETRSKQVECETDTFSFGQDMQPLKEDNSGMFNAGITSLVIGLLFFVASTIFIVRKRFEKTYTKSSRSDEYSDLQASNPAFQDHYTSIHNPIESRHHQESSANTYEECGNASDAAAYQNIENMKSGHKKEEKNLGIYDNMKI